MNIGALANVTSVSTHTLRYYEKQGLLDAPLRAGNGYRSYTKEHAERVRFIRGAQTLGFSLAEIHRIIPRVASGIFNREEIEQLLNGKVSEIDAHIRQLRSLKRELIATFALLKCEPRASVSISQVTYRKAMKKSRGQQSV